MYTIDTTKGTMVGTVSAQWAQRPDDQRFLSLSHLESQTRQWANESRAVETMPSEIHARADGGNLLIDCVGAQVDPTAWSFDQISRLAHAPSDYLRQLPAGLAAACLNQGLADYSSKPVAAYIRQNGTTSLRGITSTKYGRILDTDVVSQVRQIAGDGTGDTRWKVPGVIDWQKMAYNPRVDISKETTTLYASDRDVFMFLVDDLNPIEVGKLRNGEPDLLFRGFYVWNSEVGGRTFGFASMYLRGVCQNRNLWGVEDFREMTIRHTRFAPERFAKEAAPAILEYSQAGTMKLIEGVKAAQNQRVASTDEERVEFLHKFGFSKRAAEDLISVGLAEEGAPPETAWDFAQAITAKARSLQHQDRRIAMESVGGRILDAVKV